MACDKSCQHITLAKHSHALFILLLIFHMDISSPFEVNSLFAINSLVRLLQLWLMIVPGWLLLPTVDDFSLQNCSPPDLHTASYQWTFGTGYFPGPFKPLGCFHRPRRFLHGNTKVPNMFLAFTFHLAYLLETSRGKSQETDAWASEHAEDEYHGHIFTALKLIGWKGSTRELLFLPVLCVHLYVALQSERFLMTWNRTIKWIPNQP